MTALLKKRFNQAKPVFQESEEFANILTAHIEELQVKKKDAFKHILDIVNVLKSAASNDCTKKSSKHRKKDGDDRSNEQEPKKVDKATQDSDSGSDVESPRRKKRAHFQIITSGSERESSVAESDSYTQLKEDQKKEASYELNSKNFDEPKPDATTPDNIVSVDVDLHPPTNTQTVEDVSVADPVVLSEVEENKQENIEEDKQENAEEDKQENAEVKNVQNNSGDDDEQINAPSVSSKPAKKKKKKATNRQIRKYERLLNKLSLEIKRLSEKEMSLEEMEEEDSTHILEYQLRKRIMKVYEKLCDLKEVQVNTGRVGHRRVKFQGTRYPEINKKLEKLANLEDYFPDFHDVLTIITKVNDRKGLGLDRKRLHNIAKDAFEMIGKKLQQRRQEDFLANFSSHPTLDFVEARDPAEYDIALQIKLKNNNALGSQKLNEVTQSYEERQRTNEEMGVDMEVYSAESDHSEESDQEEPKKKKRRINLITLSDDDDERNEHFLGNDADSHEGTEDDDTNTEDDTADEANANEADDEDDYAANDDKKTGSQVETKEKVEVADIHVETLSDDEDEQEAEDDEDDDGAEDFGALSPLSISDDDSDGGNSVEEVHSPVKKEDTANKEPSGMISSTNPSASDTTLSSTNSLDNSVPVTPSSMSNGVKNHSPQDSTPSKLKHQLDKDHLQEKSCAKPVQSDSTNGSVESQAPLPVSGSPTKPVCPPPSSAVQVVDSSSSLPITTNISSSERKTVKESNSAASGPGRVPLIPCPGSMVVVDKNACNVVVDVSGVPNENKLKVVIVR